MFNNISGWYNATNQLKYIGLVLFAVIICFQPVSFSPTFIIIFFWLFYVLSFKPKRLIRLRHNFWFWWFFAFYVYFLVGVAYTDNTDESWRLFLLKVTMFLWPLAFGSIARLSKKRYKLILYFFVAGLFISSVTGLIISCLEFLNGAGNEVFFGNNLAHWRFLPNHYFSMYISFAILILAKEIINDYGKTEKFKGLRIGLVAYFMIFSILLSVRIQLAALPLSLLVLLLSADIDKRMKLRWYKWLGLLVILFSVLVVLIPSTRQRLIETFHEMRSVNGVVENKQTNHRAFIWSEAVEVIKENFWFGTGSGDADDALSLKLESVDAKFWNGRGVYYLRNGRYNYHNQFLQTFASNGVVGFMFIAGMFLISFFYTYKRKQSLVLAFLVLCVISLFTESMLERQAGVLFISFFFGLLVINQQESNQLTT